MPPVKSLNRIAEKWARVASVSQNEYTEGVNNPRADWAQKSQAAADAWNRGVQQAIQRQAFSKGVNAAGTAKWQERTLAKGPERWAQGINLSQGAYERGFAPYREVIERTTLPPRGPKGDPKNIQRVAAIADALHKAKMQRAGG